MNNENINLNLIDTKENKTITIGKRKTVTIASYLLWKISKNGGDV